MYLYQRLWKFAKAKRGEQRPGHKYTMRVVIGTKPSGAPKYRYVYQVYTKGKYVHDEDFHKVGAHIPGEHEGHKGHWHVKETTHNTVTAEHNMSEKQISLSKKEFSNRLKEEHKGAIKTHRKKLAHDLIAVRKYGTAKMRKIVATEAAMYGITFTGMYDPKTGKGETIDKSEVHRNVAITMHEDVMPSIKTSLSQTTTKFPNPDHKMGLTELFTHQIEGAARILDSWSSRDGFLLQDDAGLGKTLTALAAMVENGGERNLIIVPASGKKNLVKSWQESGKLYNLDVQHWKGADMSKPGYFIASYDEIYKKEKYFDTELGRESVRITIPDAYKQDFGTITFDECHTMANPTSTYTMAGVRLQDQAKKVLYVSATPYTSITDTHYLRKLGWFKDGDEFTKWAERAGAKLVRSNERNGALPFRMENPKSLVPLSVISALLHFEGSGVKRQPILRGFNNEFINVPTHSLFAEHLHAFEVGEQCKEISLNAGLTPYEVGGMLTLWRKSMWEAAKVETAISHAKAHLNDPAHKEKGQVAIFTEYTKHEHNELSSLSRRLKDRVKKGELDKTETSLAIKQIDNLVSTLPTHNVYDRLNEEFGGEANVANIHGLSKTDSREEQRAYQTGQKKVLVASAAKAGIGMSFHDTVGDAPRLQINTSLPWAGNTFQQLSGRSHRLGSKSDSRMVWLMGDDDSERNVASIVGTKLRSMGALVAGDPGKFIDHGLMQNYEYSSGHDPEIALQAHEAEFSDAPTSDDPEVQAARDNFRMAVNRYREHADPLAEQGERLAGKRESEKSRQRRIAVAQLMTDGVKVHNHAGLRYRLDVPPDSRAHRVASKIQRGATIDKKSNQVIVHDPRVLKRLAKELGLDKVSVKTPKNLSDNTLSRMREKYRGVLHKGNVMKPMRFLKLYKSTARGVDDFPLRFLDLVKAAGEAPVGTTHRWRNGKLMKKISPGKWVEVIMDKIRGGVRALVGQRDHEDAGGMISTKTPTGLPEGKREYVATSVQKRIKAAEKQKPEDHVEDEFGHKITHDLSPLLERADIRDKDKAILGELTEFGLNRIGELLNTIESGGGAKSIGFQVNPRFFSKGARDPEHDVHQEWIATWRNAKGAARYMYTKENRIRSDTEKWRTIRNLFPQMEKSQKAFHAGFNNLSLEERERDGNAIMYIISKCGIRVGEEGHYKKTAAAVEAGTHKHDEPTRGAVTLWKKDVTIKGDTVHLSFTGKDGQHNTGMVTDKHLAQYMEHRMKGKSDKDHVFQASYHNAKLAIESATKAGILDASDAKRGKWTPHNWRTVVGTTVAAKALMDQGPLTLSKDPVQASVQIQERINAASVTVGKALNNGPDKALESYIHPGLIHAYIEYMGSEHLEHFFKHLRFIDLLKSIDAENLRNISTVTSLVKNMDKWKPRSHGHVKPEPVDAEDIHIDGYTLPDSLH